jgi:hypothetical protein
MIKYYILYELQHQCFLINISINLQFLEICCCFFQPVRDLVKRICWEIGGVLIGYFSPFKQERSYFYHCKGGMFAPLLN